MQPEAHIHIRKRIAGRAKHPFPSNKPLVRFMDTVILAVGVIGPLFTLPQLYEIWVQHNAAGVSALSWGGYSFLSAIWLLYGLLHREKPIIVAHSAWLIFNSAVAIGAMLY